MTKSLPLFGLLMLLVCTQSFSQAIPEENMAPVKFSDIKKQIEAQKVKAAGETHLSHKVIKEGANYHDDRWLWYWSQHTDANGYLVSPIKTFREWRAYNKNADRIKAKTTSTSQWTFTGPNESYGGYSGIGRINNMAFHPADPNTYWVATAGGGAWKTTNNGLTWAPVADYLPNLSVSDIDFNPFNPSTVYMCTGDRDGRDHYSIGVLKSYNGGQSWDTTGLTWSEAQVRLTNCLLINPLDTNKLILATSEGIYRSFNGGQTFVMVQAGNFKQVLYHPADTNILYATSFFTYQNATDAQIFRSANGGNTWTQVTNFNSTWRIELAVTPGNIALVKAVAASRDTNYRRGLRGVYSSSDTGKTFTTVFAGHNCTDNILSNSMQGNSCTGQGNYDLCLAIDPADPNRLYIGGVNTWRSVNGGASWQLINQWYANLPGVAEVHADKHFLGFHPLVPGRLFECNDGGIYRTDAPGGLLWTDVSNGLGITQFYRNAVADVSNYVIAGAQDNGSKILENGLWDDLTGGDGMDCQMDPTDPNVFYTSTQYGGSIYRIEPGNFMNLAFGIPGSPVGGWITPFILHPLNPNMMFAGYQDIYMGDNFGFWTNLTNGSLGSKNLLRLAMSPSDDTVLYALPEDSSIIWRFSNYTNGIPTVIPVPYTEKIADLKVDPTNKDKIFITFSGYGANKVAQYTAGAGWVTLNENLPNVPVNCIEIDTSNGVRYVGTDVAVFYRADTMNQWELYNKDLPAVHITDLGIKYNTNELWAATYGRGMWKSPKFNGPLSVPVIPSESDLLQVYPNPAKGAFTIKFSRAHSGKTVLCRLLDQSGRVAWQEEVPVDASGSLSVSDLSLTSGTYILEVLSNYKVQGKTKLVIF